MESRALIDALRIAARLKDETRHCVTPAGDRKESVAEHSWRMSLMAYWVKDRFPELDMDKVIRMCLIHDLGECFIGDIPSFMKSGADETREEELLIQWTESLPEPFCTEMQALYAEMSALQTPEARLYKCMDKLEAVISHNESPLSSWEPLEYELNLTYADQNVQWSDYLKELREAIREDTKKKIGKG